MKDVTYRGLVDAGAKRFTTDGPNSGGVGGLLCLDGQVWSFWLDGPAQLWGPWTYATFLAEHEGTTKRGYVDAVAYLRAALADDAP